jgi:L-asparagine transporter-like permease
MTTTTSSLYVKEKRERERGRKKAENCIRTFIIDFCLFGGVVVLLLLLLLLLMVMSTHRQDNGVFFPFFSFITIIALQYITKRDRIKKKRKE